MTVNAVCPGYVMTELIERQLENQAKTRGIPKARRGLCLDGYLRAHLVWPLSAAAAVLRTPAPFLACRLPFHIYCVLHLQGQVACNAWHVTNDYNCYKSALLQEKVIKDVLLVDQPIKRFVKPEEVRCVLCS